MVVSENRFFVYHVGFLLRGLDGLSAGRRWGRLRAILLFLEDRLRGKRISFV